MITFISWYLWLKAKKELLPEVEFITSNQFSPLKDSLEVGLELELGFAPWPQDFGM